MADFRYNFGARAALRSPCDLGDLQGWYESELKAITQPGATQILRTLLSNLDGFVNYPKRPLLLWMGCARTRQKGATGKMFRYPAELKELAKDLKAPLDPRRNGPAILAFAAGGGVRPLRSGSKNAWHIHHLYSGKFPYIERVETLHAASADLHFTQSAGLVAIHPLADAAADEYPCFAWLLRAHSFLLFGYDPDAAFDRKVDPLGFARRKRCRVVWRPPATSHDQNGQAILACVES